MNKNAFIYEYIHGWCSKVSSKACSVKERDFQCIKCKLTWIPQVLDSLTYFLSQTVGAKYGGVWIQ